MNAAQKRDILESVDHAIESIISSWSCERGSQLMDALSDLMVVKGYVEEEEPRAHDKKANDSGVIPTARKTSDDDIEPSAGDLVEASEQDDPVALARSMQGRRHGGTR